MQYLLVESPLVIASDICHYTLYYLMIHNCSSTLNYYSYISLYIQDSLYSIINNIDIQNTLGIIIYRISLIYNLILNYISLKEITINLILYQSTTNITLDF